MFILAVKQSNMESSFYNIFFGKRSLRSIPQQTLSVHQENYGLPIVGFHYNVTRS